MEEKKYILSIDQGTTGTTAMLIDKDLSVAATSTSNFEQHFPQPGWVEHDPAQILTSVKEAVSAVLEKASLPGSAVAGIGITNQRETTVAWDKKTGEALHRAIVWQCKRTADYCAGLKSEEKAVHQKTGLFIDPYFSASKMNWLLKHADKVKQAVKNKRLMFGTMDSYLTFQLTGLQKHVTDVSNASRTLLMNIHQLAWDDDLLALFEVDKQTLPEILPSSHIYGHTKGLDFLPDGIAISGIAGDQQAALFGQTCFESGQAKCTYGTGSFLLLNTGEQCQLSNDGLLTTVAWKLNNKVSYAIEGSVFIAGAAIGWLRDGLGIIEKSSDIEALAQSVASTDGVCFVPALSGLGAPYWKPDAKGMITGLNRGSTKAHIARAALEGIALSVSDLSGAMEKTWGKKINSLHVDGGASENDLLMQMQSDFLNEALIRPQVTETTALGAGFLAGLALGFWSNTDEIKDSWQQDKVFKPRLSKSEREAKQAAWQKQIGRLLF